MRTFLAVSLVTLLFAGSAAAQSVPARPELPSDLDPNHWGSYYDHGVSILRARPRTAEAAFYWASRLNPERAEPLMARWVAFHLQDAGRWSDYLRGSERVLRKKEVIAADSLAWRAMVRNPLVPRTLEILLFDQLPGRWGQDDLTRGWIFYAARNLPRAVELLGRGIARDPSKYAYFRHMRAEAFVGLMQLDSALAEMRALRAELDRADAKTLVVTYESKAMIEYAMGFLLAARRDPAAAREAMGRSLLEDLAFYPAHLFLGDRALEAGDATMALQEYDAALLADSSDALVYYHRGQALARLNRVAEATEALRQTVAREPFYAAPWFDFGSILRARGDAQGARAAYTRFIALAPRSEARQLRIARATLDSLDSAAR
jgi:tetratricopeptide (TPR) repeat protein